MEKIRLGVRAHDLGASSLKNLSEITHQIEISNIQFAPSKLPFLGLNNNLMSYGNATYLNQTLNSYKIKVPILGCYVNVVDPDIRNRKQNLDRFKNYLNSARYFDQMPIVATETGSVSEMGYTIRNYNDNVFNLMLDSIRELVLYAEKLGVVMAVEPGINHPLYNFDKTKALFSTIDSPNLKLIFDLTNLLTMDNYHQQRLIINQFYEHFGQQIIAIHLKDFIIRDQRVIPVGFGQGVLDKEYLIKKTADIFPYAYCMLESITKSEIPTAVEQISRWAEIETI